MGEVGKQSLRQATLQAFYDRDDAEVSDGELAASILRAAGVRLSDEAEAYRQADQVAHARKRAALTPTEGSGS